MPDLTSVLAQLGLAEYREAFEKFARPAIGINTIPVNQSELEPTNSRFGGKPALPDSADWPQWDGQPLGHLATINLRDIANFEVARLLPERGYLVFWYDLGQGAWGFDPKEKGFFCVQYFEESSNPLSFQELNRSALSKQTQDIMPTHGLWACCKLHFQAKKSLPHPCDINESSPIVQGQLTEEKYSEVFDNYCTETEPHHQLFGEPYIVQGDMMLEAQLVTNGLYCGDATGYNDPRAKILEKGRDDWMLLAQFDTDDNVDWMWGDAGMLYFLIKRDSLARRAFDETWMIFQCY